jgi:hypothetical protein
LVRLHHIYLIPETSDAKRYTQIPTVTIPDLPETAP